MGDKLRNGGTGPPNNNHAESLTTFQRLRRWVIGPPRDLADRKIQHHISVIALLAWVGLGADGLSSSSYGPEEAFRTLGEHTYLAAPLALLMMTTVFVISFAYSRIIEAFPHGGGGYVVATEILGPRAGVVSGGALLVDYVLTITISIAAAGDALFSLLPQGVHGLKLPVEIGFIIGLSLLNIRGLKESILVLMPIFVVFLLTHAVLLGAGIALHAVEVPQMAGDLQRDFRAGQVTLGLGGMLLLFLNAYSLGGGTYTGIEAVSNGLSIMREPRVQTGKRTMAYMAISLAITASGLILCYLLFKLRFEPGKTMNAVLAEKVAADLYVGAAFVIATLVSEGALLVAAAQAGFVSGPRVLANMAIDSWVPRRFASLSERLTTQDGILLMGGAALAALLYTKGDVRQIVVMYSINVFLTFSMTELAMCRYWIARRAARPDWKKEIRIHAVGFTMCSTILCITTAEKFGEGGWVTLGVTGAVLALCFVIRRHYRAVARRLRRLDRELVREPAAPAKATAPPNPADPTAAVLVANYDGLGIHTLLNIPRNFPCTFKNFVFLSVGVVDSADFRGTFDVEKVRRQREEALRKYVALANSLGAPAEVRFSIGTDVVDEAVRLCLAVAEEFQRITFFSGKIVFERERWFEQFLHNQTANAVQRRLQWAGHTMVVMPAKV